ncbi:MAG TPA: hypothetical protein VMW01_16475 [Williamwhitmania sp.]|nr:hypothetical protein [Williamwhitmania sp.]
MEYADKVLQYLTNTVKVGEPIAVNLLSKNPEQFVATVKMLMDGGFLSMREWEFSNDYTHIRRLRLPTDGFKPAIGSTDRGAFYTQSNLNEKEE